MVEQIAAAFAVVFAAAFASDFVDASSFDQVLQDCPDLKGFVDFGDSKSVDYSDQEDCWARAGAEQGLQQKVVQRMVVQRVVVQPAAGPEQNYW